MNNMYILDRISYGDFDAEIREPLFGSSDKVTLQVKCGELMDARSEEELEQEIEYTISPNMIQVL